MILSNQNIKTKNLLIYDTRKIIRYFKIIASNYSEKVK